MTQVEKGYNTTEQMVLALIFATTTKFRSYLLSKKFVILTLKETFLTLLHHMDGSLRIDKWLLKMQDFEYTIKVESSTRASLADLLTHFPFEKKVKSNMATLPPPIEVKLELAHSLFFDGSYKRIINKATTIYIGGI